VRDERVWHAPRSTTGIEIPILWIAKTEGLVGIAYMLDYFDNVQKKK